MERLSWYQKVVALVALASGFGFAVAQFDRADALLPQYDVWNYPGGPYPVINCGWHDTCLPGYPKDGDSLDWRSYDDDSIYWRSKSSNEQNRPNAGSIKIRDESSGAECHTVWVELISPIGTSLQSIKYLHTTPYTAGGTMFSVPSGLLPQSFQKKVGETHHNDCPPANFPGHLHQGYTHTNWVRNNTYPTRATCENDFGCATYPSVWTHYQHQRTWWANYGS